MIKKEASIEKYLFIGFIIVLLSVILVDTRFTGYQVVDKGFGRNVDLKEAELRILKDRLDQIPLEMNDLTKKKDALGKELGPIQGEINKLVKELKLKRKLEVGEIDKEIEGLRREKDKLEKDVNIIKKKKTKTNADNSKLNRYNVLADGISKFTKLKTNTADLKNKKGKYSDLLGNIGGLISEENEIKGKIEIKPMEIDDLNSQLSTPQQNNQGPIFGSPGTGVLGPTGETGNTGTGQTGAPAGTQIPPVTPEMCNSISDPVAAQTCRNCMDNPALCVVHTPTPIEEGDESAKAQKFCDEYRKSYGNDENKIPKDICGNCKLDGRPGRGEACEPPGYTYGYYISGAQGVVPGQGQLRRCYPKETLGYDLDDPTVGKKKIDLGCRWAWCGDNIVNEKGSNVAEDCDDGNLIDGDGCNSNCKIENKKCEVGDGPEYLCPRKEGWSGALTRDDPYRAAGLTSTHSGTKLVGKVSLEGFFSDFYCYCITDAQKCEVVTPPQMLGEPLSLTHSVGSIRITYSSPLMEPQIFSDGCLNKDDYELPDVSHLQNKYKCVNEKEGGDSWVACPQGEYCVSSICRKVTCKEDDPGDIAWKFGIAGWTFTDNSGIAQFVELGRDECVTNEQTGLVYLKQTGCINGLVRVTSTRVCNYPCINGVCFEPIPTT